MDAPAGSYTIIVSQAHMMAILVTIAATHANAVTPESPKASAADGEMSYCVSPWTTVPAQIESSTFESEAAPLHRRENAH